MIDASYVDLGFPLTGKLLPLDNGYIIYSALSCICPNLHKLKKISIHPIAGIPNSSKQLRLTKRSKLQIRIPIEQIPQIYEFLVEQTFNIGQNQFHLGIPEYQPLISSSSVYSRLVVIRRRTKPQLFLEKAHEQLQKLGIQGNIHILKKKNGQLQCRQVVIKKKEGTFFARGYGVKVTDLDEEDSLILQQKGIGGKHKMMCGVFVPSWNSPTKAK
ncbi:MAG: type I-MYXAN CRISPR-associated protein Cas6/Cmx6 [Xenococcaceae cyanobacterium MO_188.B29]|nr:type I-MYXAN CRISPR-associated protein Cas6/Cmx6 [Xenococcaceae cyanobacterium MO_188.B29]